MQISDVIADMLTRIRNANDAKHETVDIPASNMKKAIADILLAEGYIKSVSGYRRRQAGRYQSNTQVRSPEGKGYPRSPQSIQARSPYLLQLRGYA